jgi:hypothetical protein
MTFSMDFSNDKPDIREPIPAGTVVFLRNDLQARRRRPTRRPPEQREGGLTKAAGRATPTT